MKRIFKIVVSFFIVAPFVFIALTKFGIVPKWTQWTFITPFVILGGGALVLCFVALVAQAIIWIKEDRRDKAKELRRASKLGKNKYSLEGRKEIGRRTYFQVFLHPDELLFLFKESQKLGKSPEWYIHDIIRGLLEGNKAEKAEV